MQCLFKVSMSLRFMKIKSLDSCILTNSDRQTPKPGKWNLQQNDTPTMRPIFRSQIKTKCTWYSEQLKFWSGAALKARRDVIGTVYTVVLEWPPDLWNSLYHTHLHFHISQPHSLSTSRIVFTLITTLYSIACNSFPNANSDNFQTCVFQFNL